MPSEPSGKIALAVIEARDNVRLIQEWSEGHDLDAIRADRKTRYAIERAFIAIDAAIRGIPADVLAAHGVPAKMIAGFRNALVSRFRSSQEYAAGTFANFGIKGTLAIV